MGGEPGVVGARRVPGRRLGKRPGRGRAHDSRGLGPGKGTGVSRPSRGPAGRGPSRGGAVDSARRAAPMPLRLWERSVRGGHLEGPGPGPSALMSTVRAGGGAPGRRCASVRGPVPRRFPRTVSPGASATAPDRCEQEVASWSGSGGTAVLVDTHALTASPVRAALTHPAAGHRGFLRGCRVRGHFSLESASQATPCPVRVARGGTRALRSRRRVLGHVPWPERISHAVEPPFSWRDVEEPGPRCPDSGGMLTRPLPRQGCGRPGAPVPVGAGPGQGVRGIRDSLEPAGVLP
jgi:hypothetical protein